MHLQSVNPRPVGLLLDPVRRRGEGGRIGHPVMSGTTGPFFKIQTAIEPPPPKKSSTDGPTFMDIRVTDDVTNQLK